MPPSCHILGLVLLATTGVRGEEQPAIDHHKHSTQQGTGKAGEGMKVKWTPAPGAGSLRFSKKYRDAIGEVGAALDVPGAALTFRAWYYMWYHSRQELDCLDAYGRFDGGYKVGRNHRNGGHQPYPAECAPTALAMQSPAGSTAACWPMCCKPWPSAITRR